MVDVFISYKREERDAVRILAERLRALALEVWFDADLTMSASFDEEVAAKLREAKCVLVCWTPAAIASEWVRGEAALVYGEGKLVACFLEPTQLIPPFNLQQTEDLMRWAGQEDDPNWIRLLTGIGDRVGRPGIATFAAATAVDAPLAALRTWASAHGSDPLADRVWARIRLLEGESAEARIAREQLEARSQDQRRRADEARSKALAKARGLRDPAEQRRRFLILAGSLTALALLLVGAIVYFTDAQARERALRDGVTTTQQARTFLAHNRWHPIAGPAREKLDRLDAEAWFSARTDGSIEALQAYIADAQNTPQGKFVEPAQTMLATAQRTRHVQQLLARMRFYDGPVNGASDQATQNAIALFRYRWNLPVSTSIDDALVGKLDEALDWWTHPRLEELRARSLEGPTEADYVRFAQSLGVDAAAIRAVMEVEGGQQSGFLPDGRMRILFERHLFSRFTQGQYNESHPTISAQTAGGYGSLGGQYERLAEAFALDPEAALKATSWGRLQLLGMSHKEYGYDTVGEFVRFMSQTEANQLEAGFLGFIRVRKLDDALRRHDWAEFARRYNGPGYKNNRYDEKLRAAYERIVTETAAQTAPARTDPRVGSTR